MYINLVYMPCMYVYVYNNPIYCPGQPYKYSCTGARAVVFLFPVIQQAMHLQQSYFAVTISLWASS